MVKSGLMIGAAALLLGLGAAILSPLCVPCLAVLLGLGAGYLAGVFDRPQEGRSLARVGAIAGAIAGVGALLGQVAGAGVNSLLVGPEGAAAFMEQFGVEAGGAAGEAGYWLGLVASTLCFSVLDLALMAGFGALGGLAWGRLAGGKRVSEPMA